ncbi:helix-turn-helix domain-containing protein [Hymenobacter humi]|uniref:Helix-turn-helix domain-containing protein n=1 Tax=Hymenobacter humi TaxID=1411620 RepID=A0ABW2U8D5_9BACT
MVERIRMLLETRQLTPTQFADAIGIARPIVSHILSGRNKPSLEVVQRILAAMPDLSMPWLLNGTGPMLAAGPPQAVATSPAPPAPPLPVQQHAEEVAVGLPAEAPSPETPPALARPRRQPVSLVSPVRQVASSASVAMPAPKRFAAGPAKAASAPQKALSEPAPQATPDAPVVTSAPPAGAVPQPARTLLPEALATPSTPASIGIAAPSTAAALIAGTEKPIRRIVIFYRDGSFTDYQPE